MRLLRSTVVVVPLVWSAVSPMLGCGPGGGPDGGSCENLRCEDVPPGCARIDVPDDGCGCGTLVCGDAGGLPDAGQTPVDAGPQGTDAGPQGADAGPQGTDAGPQGTDAGPQGTDAGPQGTDAGPQGTDAGPQGTDAGPQGTDAGPQGTDAGQAPWRHAIVVDGSKDFDAATEAFSTTSAPYPQGFTAYVTWSDTHLFVAYEGVDVDANDANRWIQIHLDTDPGAGTGAPAGPRYNTQQAGYPQGFGAEFHIQRNTLTTNAYQVLRAWNGSDFQDAAAQNVASARQGKFVEISVPLADLGDPTRIGVVTLFMNETPLAEGSYAGLYEGSFTDGYYDATAGVDVPVSSYLLVDLSSPAAPNDPVNERP